MAKDIDAIVENLIDEDKGFFTVNHTDPKKITDAQVREMLSEGVGMLQEKILVKEK